MEAVQTAASPEIAQTTQAAENTTESKATEAKPQEQKAKAQDDDHEEVVIGRDKFKLPKDAAKKVKDLERGFHMKAQEAAAKEKALEAKFEKMFKENPEAMFRKYNMDPDDFAELTLTQKIKKMSMTPEQQELEALRREKEERLKAEKEAKEAEERERESKEEQASLTQLDQEIAEALTSLKFPTGTRVETKAHAVKQIAALMHDSRVLAAQGKYPEPLTAAKAAAIVKKGIGSHFSGLLTEAEPAEFLDLVGKESLQGFLNRMPPEQIYELLGKDGFTKLREWDLGRVTGKVAPTPSGDPKRTADAGSAPKAHKPGKPMNEREYREFWDRLG